MTDQRLRRLEREVAASPSLESEAALLRERLRAGTLSPERLELAAYCGHVGARVVALGAHNPAAHEIPNGKAWLAVAPFDTVDLTPDSVGRLPSPLPLVFDLPRWVRGLSRWGPTVQVRAAVAAARAALPIEHPCFGGPVHVHDATGGDHYGGDCDLALFAIEGAEKWLEDPTPKNLLVWRNAWFACEWEQAQWLPWVSSADYPQPSGPPTVADQASHIIRAGSLAGDAPVRAAIQSALIAWALGNPA